MFKVSNKDTRTLKRLLKRSLKRNSLSSQAYNNMKNVSVSVVSLIVKFSHKVH